MARINDIVFDCRHAASLGRFWAAALDGYQVAAYDEEELERLRAQGIDDPEDDPTVLVEHGGGDGPRLWFQRVPETKTVKNRVHLDLRCEDPDAEIEKLEALGAVALEDQPNPDVTVMRDPDGNEFCILR